MTPRIVSVRAKRDDDGPRRPAGLGRFASRRLVFDSGVISLDDPKIVAIQETWDDLTRAFVPGGKRNP